MYILLYGLVGEINTPEQIKIREAVERVDDRNFKWVERAVAKHEVYHKIQQSFSCPCYHPGHLYNSYIESFNKNIDKDTIKSKL